MRYLIAGAGPAGVVAAETLRRQDPGGEVVLIAGEPEPPYSRMALPYYLAEQIGEEGTHLRHTADHFRRNGIQVLHDRVRAVDTRASQVRLASGTRLDYQRLLLAMGSEPLAPPVPGLDQPGIHHCWTLEDARQIARLARPGSRVVLMGAGFIGCIIMEALLSRGVRLAVVEKGDRMVPRMLDQTAGNLLRQWCVDKGVEVHTSARVDAVDQEAGRLRLQITPGRPLSADLLVVAAGVRPNLACLAGSGIRTDQGVLVDDYLQTSAAGVYAAGDVCEGKDWSSGEAAVHAIQPTATEHGRIAALNMLGQRTPYQGSLNMNVLDTMGLISSSFGRWMGVDGGDHASLLDARGYRYLKLQFQDDRLVGAATLGLAEQVGVIRGLIQSRLHLGDWKRRLQADPTRLMDAYLACVSRPSG